MTNDTNPQSPIVNRQSSIGNRLRLAVLLSGSGTTLENLVQKRSAGELDADIAVVVSSRAEAFGLERARKHNIPALTVSRRGHNGIEDFSKAIFEALIPITGAWCAWPASCRCLSCRPLSPSAW